MPLNANVPEVVIGDPVTVNALGAVNATLVTEPPPPPPEALIVTTPDPLSVIVTFVPSTKSKIDWDPFKTPFVFNTMPPPPAPPPPEPEPPTAKSAGISQADQSHGTESVTAKFTPVNV